MHIVDVVYCDAAVRTDVAVADTAVNAVVVKVVFVEDVAVC